MTGRAELAPSDQFKLHALFEITAGCGLVFAVLPYRDFVLFTVVFAILAVWCVRVPSWPVRMSLMVWLGGCCVFFLGLVCIEQALTPMFREAHLSNYDDLVFFGTMTATLGVITGGTGLALLLLVIGAARRRG